MFDFAILRALEEVTCVKGSSNTPFFCTATFTVPSAPETQEAVPLMLTVPSLGAFQ